MRSGSRQQGGAGARRRPEDSAAWTREAWSWLRWCAGSLVVTYACLALAAWAAQPAHTAVPRAEQPPAVHRAPPATRSSARLAAARRRERTHFTVHSRSEFTCAGARDARRNCTRCLPGWRGASCSEPVAVQPCTLQLCLAWARCPWGQPLRVHVHATPAGADAEWLDGKTSAEYRDVLAVLRASSRHVAAAADACLLVPWFDTLCIGNRCTNTWTDAPKAEALGAALQALPGWNGGENHLVFDMSSAYAPTLPIGRGVYAATSFWAAGQSFRHGHDQPLPLWNQKWRTENTAAHARARRSAARPLLLTFKGQRMFWCGSVMCAPQDVARGVLLGQLRAADTYKHGWVRNQLGALHNGRDVVVATKCARELADAAHCNAACRAQCAADKQRYDALDYQRLLLNSTFGLVLPGITPMSYRLAETLACGAIPVIVSDFIMLPFAQLLDWHAFSVRVSESQLLQLPQLLSALRPERLARMRERAIEAYERCFATPGQIALCAVDQLEVSLFGSWASD